MVKGVLVAGPRRVNVPGTDREDSSQKHCVLYERRNRATDRLPVMRSGKKLCITGIARLRVRSGEIAGGHARAVESKESDL